MLIQKQIFDIYATMENASFGELSATIKNSLGISLMVYQYADLRGLSTLAQELDVPVTDIYSGAFWTDINQISTSKSTQTTNYTPIIHTTSCGSCGGGQVR